MRTPIIQTGARWVVPLLLLTGLALFVRGHDAPGGGFIGALLFACGLIYQHYAFGLPGISRAYPSRPLQIGAVGLILAAVSFLPGGWFKEETGQGVWIGISLGAFGDPKTGTPVLFDLGVFLLVIGMILTVLVPPHDVDDAPTEPNPQTEEGHR